MRPVNKSIQNRTATRIQNHTPCLHYKKLPCFHETLKFLNFYRFLGGSIQYFGVSYFTVFWHKLLGGLLLVSKHKHILAGRVPAQSLSFLFARELRNCPWDTAFLVKKFLLIKRGVCFYIVFIWFDIVFYMVLYGFLEVEPQFSNDRLFFDY